MKCGERQSRRSGYFLASLVLATAAWIVVLVAQALLTSSVGHDAVGVLWFATIVQFFVNVGVTRRVFCTGGTCPHQQQIANFTSMTVVLGVIGVDRTVYSNDQRQQATAAGWIILSVINILWVLHFSKDTGAFTDKSRGFPEEEPLSAGSRSSLSQRHTASTFNQSDPPSDTMVEKHTNILPPLPSTSTSTDNSKGNPREESVLTPSHTPNATPSVDRKSVSDVNRSSRASSYLMRPYSPTTASDLNHPPSLSTVSESLQSGTTTAPEYSRRAQANWTYQAAEAEELSFTADEILYVTMAPQEKWWEARKMDGSKGMVPSNFLRLLPS
ncbi:hypothetical protein ARMSODRAFT_1018611 [Armillaria solidipes]|uniref:SH3 domain-containing protein n=1 Tax=Armillaria solidipes TaxID=1076256 RepID=A0A2H3BG73_9AGAR|nr:hypothetical protein ARMSODRAFT_1018611 [Armillaria solidipes]